ncbi:hypothetical protein G7K71_08655 [Desulfofundulus sp. TPOSR]|uniref:hypothetical protein n=1 Tax=Desulfofundulus sp. TPOSR TaxID=2714340 RepID=UPI0014090CDE|nr:hypothetical protein [Desulfofundulus sp. TPOSR]NHM25466.1 hypothetical protein [Desulfofundulus sp. TPOSR]NHM27054.1 hypothetical protein [Desulfofundulus sp. TPOSR]
MLLITTDIGQVKVGDTVLPGVFESLEITGSVKLDMVEIRGKQDKVTQAVGYDNARVRLTINLVPTDESGDCYQQIAVFQKIFRKSPQQAKPGVYKLINKHAVARGISEVVFSDLKTFEDNRTNKVLVIAEFIEHVPVQVKVAQKTSPSTSKSKPKPKPKPKPVTPAEKVAKTRLGYGDLRQKMALQKTESTPAKDTREPGLGKRILAWLRGAKDV